MIARLALVTALTLGLGGAAVATPLSVELTLPATSPLLQTVDEIVFKWGVWIGNDGGRSYDDDDDDDDGHRHWKKHKHKHHPVWHDDDDDDGQYRKRHRDDDDDDD